MTINRFALLLAAVAVVLFLLVCHPSGLYFLCDDFANVPEAARGNFFQTELLRPLLYISLWLDSKGWGFNAEGFCFTNLLLHLVNAFGVFLLCKALQKRWRLNFSHGGVVPLFAALLFLCYAFHSEPLFWIISRDASLCTLFLQLGLLFYLKGTTFYRVLSGLFFIAGLFTYELSWAFPLLLTAFFLYERFALRKSNGWGKVGLYWLVLLLYLAYRFGMLRYGLAYGAETALSGKFITLFRNLGTLVARLLVPPMQSGTTFLLSFLFVCAGLFFLLIRVRRKAKRQFFAIAFTGVCSLIALLPAVSLGIDVHDTEGERLLYAASVFACMFFVFTAASLLRQQRVFFLVMAATIALNLYGLFLSSRSYRYASSVSRFTLNVVNKKSAVGSLRFVNLPAQYKGALLFRTGFVNNTTGILKKTYDSVTVVSYQELVRPVRFSLHDGVVGAAPKTMTVEFRGSTVLLY